MYLTVKNINLANANYVNFIVEFFDAYLKKIEGIQHEKYGKWALKGAARFGSIFFSYLSLDLLG